MNKAPKLDYEMDEVLELNEQQCNALTKSIARLEIMEVLYSFAPCSVTDIARELGRSPKSLYYHLAILQDLKMVKPVGVQMAGKREEVLYGTTAKRFQMVSGEGPKAKQQMVDLARVHIKIAERECLTAYSNGYQRKLPDGVENSRLARKRGRLTDEALLEVFKHLDAIRTLLEEGKQSDTGNRYGMTFLLSPLEDSNTQADQSR